MDIQKKISSKPLKIYGQHLWQSAIKLLIRVVVQTPVGFKVKVFPERVLHAVRMRGPGAGRLQRVFLKKGISPIDFFMQLNERKVNYILLRWWEDLPSFPIGEDVNILIKDEQRGIIDDLVSMYDERGIKCDIYTQSGSGNGSRNGVPVFPYNLSQALLNDRIFYNGAYIPSPILAFASMAYHAVLHKGYNSGIPGFEKEPIEFVFDYTEALRGMAQDLNLQVEITVMGIFHWLRKEGFAPADDTLAKLVKARPELSILETRLSSDARGGELMVFVIREKLLHDGYLHDFKTLLEDKYFFDVLDVRLLNEEEKHDCTTQIRGGKWDSGPFPISGGTPAAFIIAYDYHPKPLSKTEQKEQNRMTNRNNLKAKYGFRDYLGSILTHSFYNGVHSADNENDAWFYISHLGEEYVEKIRCKVEKRRRRYAPVWSVKKVLSAGRLAKVELIKYKEGLAVKKTFRPGCERFLERELFAVRELAPHLPFIPPLLEEGEGFFVVPYFENILEGCEEKTKKELIASKAKQIVQVKKELQKRGLTYINFTPESLIITREGELFCTDFSYLQDQKDCGLDNSYEKALLPDAVCGDNQENLQKQMSSFSHLWSDYLSVNEIVDLEDRI